MNTKKNKAAYSSCNIPESITNEVIKALEFFPSLQNTRIDFTFSDNVRKSFMQAQPRWKSIFVSRKKRSYIIKISRKFRVEDQLFSVSDIPADVLTGWIGHELGHVIDYSRRSTLGMILLGIRYLYSDAHIRTVERDADHFAVRHGMADYILKTKEFILNHSSLSESYKSHIRKYYLSPEEIAEIVNQEL